LHRLLVVTFSSLDNDSRVLKEIKFYKKYGFRVSSLSVNTKSNFDFSNKIIEHNSKRIFGIPGLSLVVLYIKCFVFLLNNKAYTIVHCNDLNSLPIGVFYKFFNRNVKLIYDSHEYAINEVPYESKLSIGIKYLIERTLIKFADSVITVSDSIGDEYKRLYNITKPHIVLNCPPYKEQQKYNYFREEFNIDSQQKIFLYQGGLSKGRGVEIILEAFDSFKSDEIVLILMGNGQLEEIVMDKAKASSIIFYKSAVPTDILLNYTSSADFGISFMEDSCLSYRFCLPNKLFEYLMAGIPVLVSNLHEMKSLVDGYNVGIVAETNTVKGFSAAIDKSLTKDYSQVVSNVKKARKYFCWEEQEKVMVDLFRSR